MYVYSSVFRILTKEGPKVILYKLMDFFLVNNL